MTWSNRLLSIFLLTLTLGVGCSFGADSQSAPRSIAELQTAVEMVLKDTGTPGAGIAIVSRDKVEWVAGLGKADVTANKPATADTLFRIGSVSKGFAALAALQLQEEGKLKLTDTVKQWVPEIAFINRWEATDPVRLVHLMEHTTGFDDSRPRELALNDPKITLKDALDFSASSRVSRWRPGSRMAYCNPGPGVLAAVVEKVSGKRFEDYIQEHFFKPLHMDTATYFYTPDVEQRLTKLYHPDGVTSYRYWHLWLRSTGAINASPKDMANYVRFYLQRGSLDETQLLRASSIERMERAETLPSAGFGPVADYGLFNYTMIEGPFVFHGHNGGMDGALAEMAYLPDAGCGYAFMINSRSDEAQARIAKLIRQYLIRDLAAPVLPPATAVSAEVRQHYAGYYQGVSPRTQMLYPFERLFSLEKLTFTAHALSMRGAHGGGQWVPVSERLFRKANESVARLVLLPDADGEVLIQADKYTLKKVSAFRVWGQSLAMGMIATLLLSSLLFSLIWGPAKAFGKLRNSGPVSIRVMPLLRTGLLIAFIGLFWSRWEDGDSVGVRSLLSISITFFGIAFALTAAGSLYVVYRERSATMNRGVYWHSVLVSAALAVVAIYLGYWGLIGLRLWAY
jgi:CubicO group peptidase (beta-lactamase class C family)